MPQPINKLNRVLKAISTGKSNQLPPASSRPKQSEEYQTEWKLAWMNVYDEARRELTKLRSEIAVERAKNQTKSAKNQALKNELQKEWARTDKKAETIKRLKEKIKELKQKPTAADKSTQTESVLRDVSTQIEIASRDDSTQTDDLRAVQIFNVPTQPDDLIADFSVPSPMKADVFSADVPGPSTAASESSTVNTKKFKCPHCDYGADKKSGLADHLEKHNKPSKDFQCKMCKKLKTRRELRHHINNYLRGQHKRTGLHANYSLEDHQIYHQELFG